MVIPREYGSWRCANKKLFWKIAADEYTLAMTEEGVFNMDRQDGQDNAAPVKPPSTGSGRTDGEFNREWTRMGEIAIPFSGEKENQSGRLVNPAWVKCWSKVSDSLQPISCITMKEMQSVRE